MVGDCFSKEAKDPDGLSDGWDELALCHEECEKQNPTEMRVIIAGGRDYADYDRLNKICLKLLGPLLDIEIVSGCAAGADSLGERFARDRGIPVKQFPADWDGLGNKAGYVRNEKMAVYSDVLIAFWNLHSHGTKHMIDLAKKHAVPTVVIVY